MNRQDLFYALISLVQGGHFCSTEESDLLPSYVVGLTNGIQKKLFVCTDQETYKDYECYRSSVLVGTRVAQINSLTMHTLFADGLSIIKESKLATFIDQMLTSNKRHEVRLSKSFEFAYSHRLDTQLLSVEDNSIVFGKCNNLNGHGHNAILEVTIKGYADPVTGMVINFTDLSRIVKRKIIELFDHKNLNADLASLYKGRTTTCENTLHIIWNELIGEIPIIESLRLSETNTSWAELRREDF